MLRLRPKSTRLAVRTSRRNPYLHLVSPAPKKSLPSDPRCPFLGKKRNHYGLVGSVDAEHCAYLNTGGCPMEHGADWESCRHNCDENRSFINRLLGFKRQKTS